MKHDQDNKPSAPTQRVMAICALGLLLLSAAPSWSQEALGDLAIQSYEQLIDFVKANNPDLKSYRLNVQKAQQDVQTNRSYLLPSITGTVSGQKNLDLASTPLPGEMFGEPGTTQLVQFGTDYNYNAGISVYKSLLDWQSSLQVKMSKLSVEYAEVQESLFIELLEQQTGLYYYSALIAQRAVEVWEEDLQLADSVLLLVQRRYDEGLLEALARNQAKINVTAVKQNLNNSQQLYDQSVNELKKLLGQQPGERLQLEQGIDYDLPVILGAEQLKVSPQVALADINTRQAETDVRLQKSLFVPKLSFSGYFGKQQFTNDFAPEFGNSAWTNFNYIGLSLSVPIFSGFSNRSKLKSSQLSFQKFQNDLSGERLAADLRDDRLISDYHASLQNTRLSKDALELYAENKTLSYEQYAEGLISLDRYLTAFEDYLKAENTFLNSLLNTYNYYSQITPRLKTR